MLKKIRIFSAAIFFLGITLLFVGIGHEWWGWMAKLQLLPSVLALNFLVIAGIVVLTLISGRIYCSVICPMGVFQDLVIFIRSKVQKKHKFKYRKELKWVRYPILVAYIAAMIAGVQVAVALIAPYSAYGRVVRSFVGIAQGSAWQGGLWVVSILGLVTFLTIALFAWFGGRTWCNAVCPVGTTLSFFSRFAIFRPVIDKDVCVSCGKCERSCKASCIDSKSKTIDYSRCVDCFDCIGDCPKSGLKFKLATPKATSNETKGRRQFLATTALVAVSGVAAKAQNAVTDGGFAEVLDKKEPERRERLVPPGAESMKNFYSKCTGCQLCVSACENSVLRPSTDIEHLLQPKMGFDKGWCRPECTACSDVCPTGAILPLSEGEKMTISVGVARVDHSLCVVNRDGVSCGNCERHCPNGAIRLIDGLPVVNEELCMGCGACENLCPSRPVSAIVVDGRSTHKTV